MNTMMINSGKLTKRIIIQHLEKFKDEYGYEVESWIDVYSARAWIYARKDTSVTVSEYESMNTLELVCIIRHISDCVKYHSLDYRIMYDCMPHQIVGIDNEDKTQTKFILKQINQ
jgi:head-tail adaptor